MAQDPPPGGKARVGGQVTITVGETTRRLPVVGVSLSPEHLLSASTRRILLRELPR